MVKPYFIQWSHHLHPIRLRIGAIAIVSLGYITLTPLGLSQAVAQLTLTPQGLVAQNQQETPVLWVNPIQGDDSNGNGDLDSPFKTIAKALQVAQPNTVIVLTPGVYSSQTGETFPLVLPPGVTLQGNPRTRGENIIIQGGGLVESPTASQVNVTILAANAATVTGVTITNPNPQGYGLWIESSSPIIVDNTFTENTSAGIVVKGNSAPTIRSNYFYNNGGDGILVTGTLQADVRENVFINQDNTNVALNRDRISSTSVESPENSSSPESLSESVEPSVNPSPTADPIPEAQTTISQFTQLPTTLPPDWRTLSQLERNPPESTETQPEARNQPAATSSISAASFPVPSSLQSQQNPTPPTTPAAVPRIVDIPVPSPTEIESSDPSTPNTVGLTEAGEEENLRTDSSSMTATPTASAPAPEVVGVTVNSPENPSRDSVPVLSSNHSSTTSQESPPEPALEGRYRVLVAATSDEQQTLVRSLIPGAFRTSYNGQLMMQVGLFNSRENAQQILDLLQEQGLTVTVETLR